MVFRRRSRLQIRATARHNANRMARTNELAVIAISQLEKLVPGIEKVHDAESIIREATSECIPPKAEDDSFLGRVLHIKDGSNVTRLHLQKACQKCRHRATQLVRLAISPLPYLVKCSTVSRMLKTVNSLHKENKAGAKIALCYDDNFEQSKVLMLKFGPIPSADLDNRDWTV